LLIHIDANIPIYVWGRDHPLKAPSEAVMALATDHPESFFTDAEVLQEILHKFRALRSWDAVRERFFAFSDLMEGRIEPMTAADVKLAADLSERYPSLSARGLIHAAVCYRMGAVYIVSADSALDVLEGIERLDPLDVDSWRQGLFNPQP
jgi:predicted nucleic acid-binding protein